MGSSASVAVAIIRAMYDLFSLELDRQTLLKLADVAEKDTHKNPSGLDRDDDLFGHSDLDDP